MKIYIAASSRHDIDLAEQLRYELQSRGHDVVDWMSAVRAHGPDPMDASRGRDSLAQLESIRECDVLVFLEPADPHSTIGAWIEVTAARCWDVPIVQVFGRPRAIPWPMAWIGRVAACVIHVDAGAAMIADRAERAGAR